MLHCFHNNGKYLSFCARCERKFRSNDGCKGKIKYKKEQAIKILVCSFLVHLKQSALMTVLCNWQMLSIHYRWCCCLVLLLNNAMTFRFYFQLPSVFKYSFTIIHICLLSSVLLVLLVSVNCDNQCVPMPPATPTTTQFNPTEHNFACFIY